MRDYINIIPMMSFNEKVLKALPAEISEIMEQVLAKPLATTQKQVRNNLEKLEQKVKNINHFLTERAIVPRHTSNIGQRDGVVAGGVLLVAGSFLASPGTFGAGIVLKIILAPFSFILGTPLIYAGAFVLALQGISWFKGKKRQKTEILASTENQITEAFYNIRTTKLPMMRQQGELLATRLKDSFREKMKQCQDGLNEALDRKALPSGDKMDVLKAEAACQCLADLLDASME